MVEQINDNSNNDPTATTTTTTNAVWSITKYKYKNKCPIGNNSHNVSPIQKSLKGAV